MAGYGLFRPSIKEILLMIEAVLLYYDYLLTLPDEVDRLWHTGPQSWASIVFFLNRYLALVGHIPFVWNVYADPCKTGVGPIRSLTLRSWLIFLLPRPCKSLRALSLGSPSPLHTTRLVSLSSTSTMAH
jgi:hypothetical protein